MSYRKKKVKKGRGLTKEKRNGRQRKRRQVFKRDQGICAMCDMDVAGMEQRVKKLLDSGVHPFILAERLQLKPKELNRTLWDVDHVVPLVEGGTNQLDNMRTLCVWCHKEETKSLSKRLSKTVKKVLMQKQYRGIIEGG